MHMIKDIQKEVLHYSEDSFSEKLHVPVEGLDVSAGAVQGGEDEGDGRHSHADAGQDDGGLPRLKIIHSKASQGRPYEAGYSPYGCQKTKGCVEEIRPEDADEDGRHGGHPAPGEQPKQRGTNNKCEEGVTDGKTE